MEAIPRPSHTPGNPTPGGSANAPAGPALRQSRRACGKRQTFNAQEQERDTKLFDLTDRKYDAMIGGFPSPDRLWEKFRSTSPYVYCANNPLGMTDPGGVQARSSVQTVYNDEGGSSSAPAEKKGSVVGRVVVGALQDAGWGIAKSMIDVYFPIVPIYEFASGPKKYVGGYVTAFENATGQNGGEEAARFWPAQGIAVAATYGAVKVAGMREPVDVKLLQEGKPEAKQFAPTQLDKPFAKHGSEWGEGNITKMSYENARKAF